MAEQKARFLPGSFIILKDHYRKTVLHQGHE